MTEAMHQLRPPTCLAPSSQLVDGMSPPATSCSNWLHTADGEPTASPLLLLLLLPSVGFPAAAAAAALEAQHLMSAWCTTTLSVTTAGSGRLGSACGCKGAQHASNDL